MKILEVLRTVNKQGGISRCVFELATQLSKTEEVHLLTNKFAYIPNVEAHTYFLLKKPFWLQILHNSRQTKNYIQRHRSDYDLIASHDAESPVCDVLHKHSVYSEALRKMKETRGSTYRLYKTLDPRAKIILDIEEKVVGTSKHIIAVSHIIRQELMKNYGVPSSKITVVHNGVNTNEFHPNFREQFFYEIRKKHHIKTQDTVLLFAGSEWHRKGLDKLVMSLRYVKHKVKVLAVGPTHDQEDFEELAKKNHLPLKNIIFAGPTQHMQRYYAASDIFVFPTLYEPFGLVITEAMASGLPVITTKQAGASELIKHRTDGFILEENTPEEIAQWVDFILDNNLAQRIGQNARRKAEDYSWTNQANKTMQAYRRAKDTF